MTELADRYQLFDTLYADGDVIAYRAHDRLLSRAVTVQMLRPERAADTAAVDQMLDKGRRAALAHLPHVASIYDQPTLDEQPCLVFEAPIGPALSEAAPLAPAQAIDMASQLAATCRAAFGRGEQLPALGPQMVRIDPDGRTQVLDLGVGAGPTDEPLAVRCIGTLLATAIGDRDPALQQLAAQAAAGQIDTLEALQQALHVAHQQASSPTTVVPRAPVTMPIETPSPRATRPMPPQPIAVPRRAPEPSSSRIGERLLWIGVAAAVLLALFAIVSLRAPDQSSRTAEQSAAASVAPQASAAASSQASAPAAPTTTIPGQPYVVAARNSATVRVRSGPGLGFDQITSLRNGTPVEVISEPQPADNYTWVRIRAGEVDGWCILEALRKR